jgi:nucleoside-diphosphate-sugar epimerase
MARKVFVVGGTRYFGKKLVHLLLKAGDKITLATRGNSSDSFGTALRRLHVDRTDTAAFRKALGDERWDLVYDQVCYSPDEARDACEILRGKVGRYVHTSTQSVYMNDGEQSEADFDPLRFPLRQGSRTEISYSDAKRGAEAVFFAQAEFPIAAMRIPIVLGPDDYTGRLEFHIDRVRLGHPIVVPNRAARTSFISSDAAARFLFELGHSNSVGPLNAASPETVSILEMMEMISAAVGKNPVLAESGPDEDRTPFTDRNSRYLSVAKARSLGFSFEPLSRWLPKLIQEVSHRR